MGKGDPANNMGIYLFWLILWEWGEKGSPGLLLGGDMGLGVGVVWGFW